MYKTMDSPIKLGAVTLKNRIIFAPTTMGLPQEDYFEKLRQIAAGGCAMIIIGDVPVGKSGFGHSLYKKKGFAYYQKLASIAHEHHCKICAQLHKSDSDLKAMLKYIPGILSKKITMEQLRPLLNAQVGPYISGLTPAKVKAITASFGDAAALAQKAGFDMVQVHGDRMCGSFCSTLFNHRSDEYGGPPENRARFAIEAVSAIRKRLPDYPIDFKLAVRQENPHYGNAGILAEELRLFVPLLEQAGVTSFHVALANHARLSDTIPPNNHPYFAQEGCFLKYCKEVRKFTALPICGVGGLTSPDFVEEQLAQGRIDCAAMSRQLIADPAWVQKVFTGKTNDIHRCVRCNKECLGGLQKHRGAHCFYEKEPVPAAHDAP